MTTALVTPINKTNNNNAEKEAAPKEVAPKKNLSKEGVAKDVNPKEAPPKVATSKEATLKEANPKETPQKEGIRKEAAPKEEKNPKEATPKVPNSKETTPKVPNSKEATPKVPNSKEATQKVPNSKEATPKVPNSKEATPIGATPNEPKSTTTTITNGVELVDGPKSAITTKTAASVISTTSTVINLVDARDQNTVPRKPLRSAEKYDPDPTPRLFHKKSKSNEKHQPSTTTPATSAEPSTNVPSKEVESNGDKNVESGGVTSEKSSKEPIKKASEPLPIDNYNIVFIIMVLHGFGTLIAWNVFMTISPLYFKNYKLGNDKIVGDKPWYIANFMNFICLCGQLPNLTINGISLFIESGSLFWRVVGSLLGVFVLCLATVIFIFVDTSEWVFGFFVLTMVMVVFLNIASGFYQNTIFGLAGSFPPKYINAVLMGNNFCGFGVTVICIIVTQFIEKPAMTATVYFMFALVALVACIGSFIFLQRNKFFVYYLSLAQVKSGHTHGFRDYFKILKDYWPQLLNVVVTFTITFFLFPSVLIEIKLYPKQRAIDHDSFIPLKQYANVVVFLSFCVFCVIGNTFAKFIQYPTPKYLSIIVFLRILFIPIFYICNYSPDGQRRWEPIIKNEWIANILIMFFSFSHGHVSSLAMMYAPLGASPSKAFIIGKMSSFFLICGVVSGIVLSFGAKYVV